MRRRLVVKKRILSMAVIVSLVFTLSISSIINSKAANNSKEKIDGSYLTMQETSKATLHSGIITRGQYMMDGECSITKSGLGKIYVYASTTSNFDVDYLSTIIYVDQYNEKDKAWDQIDAWQVEKFNTYYVSTSKMMNVPGGYFYRVHADHAAGMDSDYPYDEATTATDGIFIK